MKKSIKEGIIVTADFGLMSLANLTITVLLAKSITLENYSLYVLATSILMMLISVNNAVVLTPYTVIAPKLSDYKRKVFKGTGLLLTVLIIVFFMVSLLIYLSHTENQYENINKFTLLLSAFYFWSFWYVLREQMRFTMLADLNIKAGFIANVTGSILILIGLITLFIQKTLNLETLLYVLMFSTLVPPTIMLIVDNKRIIILPRYIKYFIKKYWALGKWNLVNAVLYSGTNLSLPWLILWFSDKKSVAIYGVCLSFSSIVTPLLRGINSYLFPKMTHNYNNTGVSGLWKLIGVSIFVMLVPYLIWFLIVIIWGDDLLIIFYSNEYSGYQWVITLVVFKMMLDAISTPINSALQTLERPYVLTIALAAGFLITIFIGLNLIQQYGIFGAAVLGVLSSSLMILIRVVFLKKIINQTAS